MEAFVEQCVLRIKEREAREHEKESERLLRRFLADARKLKKWKDELPNESRRDY